MKTYTKQTALRECVYRKGTNSYTQNYKQAQKPDITIRELQQTYECV